LRTRLIHDKGTPHEILPVQRCNCFFGFRIVLDFRKTKPARLSSESVAKKSQIIRLHSHFREQSMHLLFRGLKREIAHVQFLHGRSPCVPNYRKRSGGAEESGVVPRAAVTGTGCSRLKRALQRRLVSIFRPTLT